MKLNYLLRRIFLLLGLISLVFFTQASAQTTGSVSVYCWNDDDADGRQDSEEAPKKYVSVELQTYDGSSWSNFKTKSSSESGIVLFTNVPLPSYIRIVATAPTNHVFTVAKVQEDGKGDSDILPNKGYSGYFLIESADDIPDLGVGLLAPGSVTTFVWSDADGDGKQDDDETTGVNVKVQLIEDGVALGSAVSIGNDGLYTYSKLVVGKKYQLQYTLGTGQQATLANEYWKDDKDSDLGANGKSHEFVLTKGNQDLTDIDAGILLPGSVKAYVWDDANGNGAQDDDESPIGAVSVELVRNDGVAFSPLKMGTTNSSGYVTFNNVPVKTKLKLVFSPKTGYTIASGEKYWKSEKNSDVNSNGVTGIFELTKSGEVIEDQDCALWSNLNSLQSYVWKDVNANGKQDDGESGFDGLSVELHKLNTGSGVYELVGAAKNTKNGGFVTFTGLESGEKYKLHFADKAGYGITAKSAYWNDELDSDANQSNGFTNTIIVTGLGNQVIKGYDCGYWQAKTIETYVWHDLNENGNQDDSSPIKGVKVYAESKDGSFKSLTATTNIDGVATLSGIPVGTKVQLVFSYSNAKFSFIPKQKYWDGSKNSDVNSDGKTSFFVVSAGDEAITKYDAGMLEQGSDGVVKTMVFDDANGNGGLGSSEEGVRWAQVELWKVGGLAAFKSGKTDVDGKIEFSGLDYDVEYFLKYSLDYLKNSKHLEYVFTAKNKYWNKKRDSDADVVSGETKAFTITSSNPIVEEYNAGVLRPITLTTFVWLDEDGDSRQDADEVGKQVTVTLEEKGVASVDWRASVLSKNGVAVFKNLKAGTKYRLHYTGLPAGYSFVKKNGYWKDDYDSDVNASGYTNYFVPSKGIASIEKHDAGLWAPDNIVTYVWEDVDMDGKQDELESALKGIKVELLDKGGNVLATGVTDKFGLATLANPKIGSQVRLKYTKSAGDVFTTPTADSKYWDSSLNSDVNNKGFTPFFRTYGGETKTDLDAGIYTPVTIPVVPGGPAGVMAEDVVAASLDKAVDNSELSKIFTNLKISPTIVSNEIRVEVNELDNVPLVVNIVDLSGRVLYQSNNFTIHNGLGVIDAASLNLTSGQYLLVIRHSAFNFKATRTFIIQE